MPLRDEAVMYWALRSQKEVAPAKVVSWAIEKLQQGDDQSGLVLLAGQPESEHAQVDEPLALLLEELGIETPSHTVTILLLARFYAQQINDRSISAEWGAQALWNLRAASPTILDLVRSFGGLRAAYDDEPEFRHELSEEIREEAGLLLAAIAARLESEAS